MTAALVTELTDGYGHVEFLPVHFDDFDPMGGGSQLPARASDRARACRVLGTARPYF
jgi:hypothetical protein